MALSACGKALTSGQRAHVVADGGQVEVTVVVQHARGEQGDYTTHTAHGGSVPPTQDHTQVSGSDEDGSVGRGARTIPGSHAVAIVHQRLVALRGDRQALQRCERQRQREKW